MDMENPKRVLRGTKKENIPPPLGSYLISEQRNVQKNVNINLYLSVGSHVTVSRHQAGSAVPGSHYTGATVPERLRASSIRNRAIEPLQHSLVQTNLSCPYWPLRDTAVDPSSRQQSNLKSRTCRLETVVPIGDSCPPPVARCSCPVSAKRNPPNDLSYRSRDVPWTYDVTFKGRMGNKDQQPLKQPIGCSSVLERSGGNLETNGESFSPTKLLGVLSPGCLHPDCRPPSTSPDRSVDSLPPGPALTLDHLSTSPLADEHPPSTTLQALLRSSQTSAELYNSIQRLKQEAATMGALSSFPWESKSSLSYRPRSDSRVPTSAVLSVMEQLAAEERYAKQAGAKWRTPLSGGWGPGSTVGTLGDGEPSPVAYGYKNAGPSASPTEVLDRDWPVGFYRGVGSTALALQGKESYSSASFCYLKCCSGVQQAYEGKGICGCLKTHCHQRAMDPEEPFSGVFRCSELGHRDLPMDLLSIDGLQVSLERLCAKTPVNMGVSVCNAQREGQLTVRSPGGPEVIPSYQLGNTSEDLDIGEVREAGNAPFITNHVDEFTSFSPHPNFDPIGVAGLGEHSRLVGGTNDFGPASLVGKRADGSLNPVCSDCCPGVESGQGELPCCGEKDGGIDTVRKENLEGDDGLMEAKRDDRSSFPGRSDPLVVQCFAAWRNHVYGKQAAAQALYERQLLRKGLCALQWAVQLRDVQVGVAQRSHALTVLSVSFHRWQDAVAKQQKARTLQQQEMATSAKGFPAPPERERITKLPVLCQLTAEEMQDVARYSRAERILWLQLHRTQGAEEQSRKAEAVRDMRRLAAFRLWHLQTEHLHQAEACAQEARAVLEKKNLAAAFGTWRSRFRANRRMLPLAARVQRGLISWCFNAWRRVTEQEALSRHSLECRQARSLRMCFRQWALMVRVQDKVKQTLLDLLTSKQRDFDVRLGLTPNAALAQPCLNGSGPSQRNGVGSLEGFFHALMLQKAFQAWKVRWQQSQLANVFQRVLAQRQLREALGRWRWKALSLHPLGLGSRDLVEDHLLASLDSEEYSLSSGFHSNVPAPPISRGSLEKESSLEDSSSASVSSLATTEDSRLLHHHDSPSLRCSPGSESPAQVAAEFHMQTSSPLTRCPVGEDHFPAWAFRSSDNGSQYCIVAPSVLQGANSTADTTELQNRRQLLERCFTLWSSWTHQTLQAKRHHKCSLLSRAFVSWSGAAAHNSARHKALAEYEKAGRQHLLASCFRRWKTELLQANQQRKEESARRRPTGYRAIWRWRKATRGYWALRLNSVHQACNYWTKAATLRQCVQQRSSLIGARKLTKMPLSWPSRQSRKREKRLDADSGTHSKLTCSSSHFWLTTYRCQNRPLKPLESPDVARRIAESGWTQKNNMELAPAVGHRWWLGRKYLRLWRHNILVRRFQYARDMRHLARVWLSWKDTCRTEMAVQALARQRLVEWSWKMWRRRCLQSWVAERFRESGERHLLKMAFAKWQHQGRSKLLTGWNTF